MKTKLSLLTCLLMSPLLMALTPGDNAPDVTAKNQDGKTVKISDYKGKFLLVYFYPKDETPGCTTEACSLRDDYAKIKKLNASVLGVSRQDEKSHREFKAKHKLPFDLLVDSDGAVGRAFGVASIPGRTDMSQRESILLGPDGKVVRIYPNVDPAKHTAEIIGDIEQATVKTVKK